VSEILALTCELITNHALVCRLVLHHPATDTYAEYCLAGIESTPCDMYRASTSRGTLISITIARLMASRPRANASKMVRHKRLL